MTLKAVVDNLEALDKGLHALYEKGADGKFYLGVEGLIPASRLDEFRTNNIELKKSLERFEGVDPAKYKDLVDRERKLAEKKLIEAGEVDAVVEARVKAMRTEYDGKLTAANTANEGLNRQLSSLLVDSAVKSSAVELGVVATAIDDVVLRAKTVFRVKDGAVVAVNEKGEIRYGKDGTTPLGISEWTKDLKTAAPHLFQGFKGSGAQGANGLPAGTDVSKMSATAKISAGLQKMG